MSATNDFYQQVRRVECGGVAAKADGTAGDFDIDISLTQPKDEGLQFEARIWNLAPDTWRTVKSGNIVRIRMGWGETTVETMCIGTTERKFVEREESDTVFVLTGTDTGTAALKSRRISATFRNQRVGQIARRIADYAGLSAGRIESGPQLRGCWAMKTRCGALDYWLDELVEDAERLSGEQWEWYVEGGKLNVVTLGSSAGTALVLDSDNSTVTPAAGETKKTSGGEELTFDAYLDPRIQKGAFVRVNTEDQSGVYKVTEYQVTSSTINGTHEMTGTLAPSDALYKFI